MRDFAIALLVGVMLTLGFDVITKAANSEARSAPSPVAQHESPSEQYEYGH
jgi:hypothetical protein